VKTPQVCPECDRSLADPTIPLNLPRKYRKLFTLAVAPLVEQPEYGTRWQCPFCANTWVVAHPRTRRRVRQ
jgi:hypothetical protein